MNPLERTSGNSAGTVLLVDADPELCESLRLHLEAEGISVTEAADGPTALKALRAGGIDLAVVDAMLPGEGGFALLRTAREFTDVRVIMLAATQDEHYRVAGLRQGADDFLAKPFSLPELVARIVSQLRRLERRVSEGVIRLGEVEIDLSSRRVRRRGKEVDLTRRELDLLATLASNPDRALSRDELLRVAWKTEHLTPKTVDVHIASLRRKLRGALDISTMRGVGYRLEA